MAINNVFRNTLKLAQVLFILISLIPFMSVHATTSSPFMEIGITLNNKADIALVDHQIQIQRSTLRKLPKHYLIEGISARDNTKLITTQTIDTDQDGIKDTLIFNTDIPAQGKKTLTLIAVPNTKLSAQASKYRAQFDMGFQVNGRLDDKGRYVDGEYQQVTHMVAPPGHERGNLLFRYEGFGWESDKVGYRYYFDQRSTIDIFGKRLPAMVLQDVGHPGNNYHAPAEWGLDVLKVGDSLGLGSLGIFHEGKTHKLINSKNLRVAMLDSGPLLARFNVLHDDWRVGGKKTNVSETYAISAGSRLTKATAQVSKSVPNLTTGIVKAGLSPITSNNENSAWGYMATYGKQSVEKDGLGMAIFFRTGQLLQLTDDDHSHLVVLKPNKKSVTYYFGAAWVQELNGVKDEAAFRTYLEETRKMLNHPIDITIHN